MRVAKVHVLNLSIGGPDSADAPFLRKVDEVIAAKDVMRIILGRPTVMKYGFCGKKALQGWCMAHGLPASVTPVHSLAYRELRASLQRRWTTTASRWYRVTKPKLSTCVPTAMVSAQSGCVP